MGIESVHTPPLRRHEGVRARYRAALLAGDCAAARVVIDGVMRGAHDALEVLEEVMTPTLHDVGRAWEAGEIGVTEEYFATECVERHLDAVRLAFPSAPGREGTAVVGTVAGEGHLLAARMAADALALDGWDTVHLGRGLPADAFAAYVARRSARLVAVSVTLAQNLPQLRELVDALRALDAAPAILVGGAVVRDGALPDDVLVDAARSTLREGVAWARTLAAARKREPSLEAWLLHVGSTVRALRGKRGWSQAELAEAAGLHRAYVSAVEGGKQNLTMEALLKLANALGVELPELLIVSEGRPLAED